MPLKKPAFILTKLGIAYYLLFFCLSIQADTPQAKAYPDLTTEQNQWIGQQIFNNECAMQTSCLTSWNLGENFPSLGIGHFIWYKAGQNEVFTESFPDLILYFEEKNLPVPNWIASSNYDSPWQDRESFISDYDKERLNELRRFLAENIDIQTEFIINRFENALNEILETTPREEAKAIEDKFYAVANSKPPYGMYALIDYINFKGEGISKNEQYNNQGWGLLQVLKGMLPGNENALENYVASAKEVLQDRVSNSPAERNESRWLKGWIKRLESYLPSEDALMKDVLMKEE